MQQHGMFGFGTGVRLGAGFGLVGAVVALQVLPLFATPAEAASVTACSRYGKGCITAPVRRVANGITEVRLPHGTWIGCAGDCREKLRDETLDFWDAHRPEFGGSGRK